ncbi:hypothetical protein C4K04_6310 [Pseudomonas chlororaphis]|uniref:Uncharacterized protein n=1 Tax=Pseudomonas chlororaphis TaxID=587753 RepID=A0A3G7TZX3_9PSED|nr:hypothetical protein C4K04_6310 [Pseudomonas chlororaphis]
MALIFDQAAQRLGIVPVAESILIFRLNVTIQHCGHGATRI